MVALDSGDRLLAISGCFEEVAEVIDQGAIHVHLFRNSARQLIGRQVVDGFPGQLATDHKDPAYLGVRIMLD